MSQPVQIFIAYSRRDSELLDQYRGHISPYERNGQVQIWYDGKIEPGVVWEADIKKHLHEADIIVLLVSSDAINSDYFYDIEMKAAFDRHHKGEVRVVPIIVRPCAWKATPLADLQVLPKEGKPVTTWDNMDEAFTDAVESIAEIIKSFKKEKKSKQGSILEIQKQTEELGYEKHEDIDRILDLILQKITSSHSKFNNYVRLKEQYSHTFKRDNLGDLSHVHANSEYSNIIQELKILVKFLLEDDLVENSDFNDPLDAEVQKMPVSIPITPIYLVNCDRRKPFESFSKAFRKNKKENHRIQNYFLCTCPTQQPESFVERTLYELMAGRKEFSFNFPRHENGRLKIEPLPVAFDFFGSQQACKSYFADRFDFSPSDPFEDFLQNELSQLRFDYIVTAFKLTANDWYDDVTAPYIEWIIDTFRQIENQYPFFLFFFIITVKDAHRQDKELRESNRRALNGVFKLVERNQPHSTLIEQLLPVHTDDFEDWLEKLGDVKQEQKQRIINLLAERLDPQENAWFKEKNEFNMERIEYFQQKVYRKFTSTNK